MSTGNRQPNRRKARIPPLEEELGQALGNLENLRDRQLIARHLGWDGGQPCSLSEAGAAFQVTRERARQIYSQGLPILRRHTATPALRSILSFARRREQERACDVEQQLRQHGLTAGPFSLGGVLTAAHLFGHSAGFSLHQFGGVWFVGDVADPGRAIVLTAARQVEHHGATRVSAVNREAGRAAQLRIRKELVRRILETRSDILWLDGNSEWFWLTSLSRNRLLTRLEKVLSVFSRLPLSRLHAAISRDYRPLRIPEPVLRSFCSSLEWCQLRGDEVIATREFDRSGALSGGEAITCAILQEHGGEMELSRLEHRCYRAGVKRANLWRILSFSPLVQRLDRERYGLIWAAPATDERPRGASLRRKRL